ncbi:hypothetical protein IGB42_01700 [Andreprevotia sp. IGB-42]|uniref:hypothetical protein n=1 Tax=Andreprevotia sp. IGB-42 TaxID=2497473 RepID=UPI0013596CFC|nr:hypothetical protein [Andreprevotia sp. IGB-42]KAF0814020.1 hypothetical protein IGB42_01700 [Andreprevotia sp. IGB-42]
MRRAVIVYLRQHPLITVLVMAVAFIGFASSSVTLLMLLHANARFIWQSGWWAVREGALEQLAGLLGSGALALALYLVFKTCEKLLVEKITDTAAPVAAATKGQIEHGERPGTDCPAE